jgi:hypothetical protein
VTATLTSEPGVQKQAGSLEMIGDGERIDGEEG